jgi:hypothetical protein
MALPLLWFAALTLYAAFTFWYVNTKGALRLGEVDAFLEKFEQIEGMTPETLKAGREFLESDDGGEFVMVNLLQMAPSPVVPPGGGEPQTASEVMGRYTSHFMPALFRRAGHPIFMGVTAATYLDQWNVAPDPGWTATGLIRYRSRRDMADLAVDPAFDDAHKYKIVALASTAAFPVIPMLRVVSPRLGVGLVLALVAALTHIAVLSLGG